MPLPAKLLARLQKRGIVRDEPDEEVIAESYDDENAIARSRKNPSGEFFSLMTLSRRFVAGAPGCPNKFNPYHICIEFCYDRWREGVPESRLTKSYLRKKARMLRKYPLPPGWKEVRWPESRAGA